MNFSDLETSLNKAQQFLECSNLKELSFTFTPHGLMSGIQGPMVINSDQFDASMMVSEQEPDPVDGDSLLYCQLMVLKAEKFLNDPDSRWLMVNEFFHLYQRGIRSISNDNCKLAMFDLISTLEELFLNPANDLGAICPSGAELFDFVEAARIGAVWQAREKVIFYTDNWRFKDYGLRGHSLVSPVAEYWAYRKTSSRLAPVAEEINALLNKGHRFWATPQKSTHHKISLLKPFPDGQKGVEDAVRFFEYQAGQVVTETNPSCLLLPRGQLTQAFLSRYRLHSQAEKTMLVSAVVKHYPDYVLLAGPKAFCDGVVSFLSRLDIHADKPVFELEDFTLERWEIFKTLFDPYASTYSDLSAAWSASTAL